MQAPHYRKIELQSTADLSYLYANTVSAARQKLDLHFPPSANNDSDPMKERVRELVDEFINKTFTSAIPSISINGIDTSPSQSLKSSKNNGTVPLESLLSTRESIEYEPFDSALASKLTSLHAQLESLTTTVAQMRRDAPSKAAKEYADALQTALAEDDEDYYDDDDDDNDDDDDDEMNDKNNNDDNNEKDNNDNENNKDADVKPDSPQISSRSRYGQGASWFHNLRRKHPDWILEVPSGTPQEQERWGDGEMGDVYAKALETLFQLQGEGNGVDTEDGEGEDGTALATTVGKVDRARRAADVVEKM